MAARCPFCETVHPVWGVPIGDQIACSCGATALLCAPNAEPETSVHLAKMGLSDTKADVINETLSIVWAREWSRRWADRAR